VVVAAHGDGDVFFGQLVESRHCAMFDLIIVGGGPAGLAAALSAKRHGLEYLVVERGQIANTVQGYPFGRRLFSSSDEVELVQGALSAVEKPTREMVIEHYADLVAKEGLRVRTSEEVLRIKRESEGLVAKTNRSEYESHAVLVAVGGFGRRRRLNVPGEELPIVSHRFVDAHPFQAKRVLVVGGGNSAAEAALSLAEAGAHVALSIRRPSIEAADESDKSATYHFVAGATRAKIKPWVLEPLQRAIEEGRIELIAWSEVREIHASHVLLLCRGESGDQYREFICDNVFTLIGADPDTRLLEEAGAEIAADGRPVYNADTYETTVPGIYVGGHLTRDLHLKNAVKTARRIVDRVAARVLAENVI